MVFRQMGISVNLGPGGLGYQLFGTSAGGLLGSLVGILAWEPLCNEIPPTGDLAVDVGLIGELSCPVLGNVTHWEFAIWLAGIGGFIGFMIGLIRRL